MKEGKKEKRKREAIKIFTAHSYTAPERKEEETEKSLEKKKEKKDFPACPSHNR